MISEWTTSGVPKGYILGPFHFVIYINGIDLGLNNFICKYLDDTKIGNGVLSECDRRRLQEDCVISDWSVKCEMSYNINKCQILQVGSMKIMKDYGMCGVEIKSVHLVKGLGVTVVQRVR